MLRDGNSDQLTIYASPNPAEQVFQGEIISGLVYGTFEEPYPTKEGDETGVVLCRITSTGHDSGLRFVGLSRHVECSWSISGIKLELVDDSKDLKASEDKIVDMERELLKNILFLRGVEDADSAKVFHRANGTKWLRISIPDTISCPKFFKKRTCKRRGCHQC